MAEGRAKPLVAGDPTLCYACHQHAVVSVMNETSPVCTSCGVIQHTIPLARLQRQGTEMVERFHRDMGEHHSTQQRMFNTTAAPSTEDHTANGGASRDEVGRAGAQMTHVARERGSASNDRRRSQQAAHNRLAGRLGIAVTDHLRRLGLLAMCSQSLISVLVGIAVSATGEMDGGANMSAAAARRVPTNRGVLRDIATSTLYCCANGYRERGRVVYRPLPDMPAEVARRIRRLGCDGLATALAAQPTKTAKLDRYNRCVGRVMRRHYPAC